MGRMGKTVAARVTDFLGIPSLSNPTAMGRPTTTVWERGLPAVHLIPGGRRPPGPGHRGCDGGPGTGNREDTK